MRRVILCVLSCCVLASVAFLGGPAKAGGDYGYHRGTQTRVWYTSSCCYRRIVRHTTSVRYVRINRGYRAYRHSYYRPYRYGDYRRSRYYGHKRYYVVRYDGDYGGWRGYSYRYANFVSPPDCRLVRIADLDGSWIWARRAGCF